MSEAATIDHRGELRREKVDRAQGVVERYRDVDEVVAIYYGGSLFAGLGNLTSDVDVFVVIEDTEHDADLEQVIAEGQRIDLEFKTPEWLHRISHLADELEISTMNYGQLLLPKSDVDGAVRLLQSEDAFDEKSASRFRDHLRSKVDVLRQILMLRAAFESASVAEDLVGMLDDGDGHSAALVSRDLLLEGLSGYLAGCGDLYMGRKWTWPKLRRSAGERFPFELVEDLLGRDGETQDQRLARAYQRLYFTQLLLVAAFASGWERPDAASWRSWDFPAGSGPMRSHEWMPMRLKDRIVLTRVADGRPVAVSLQGLMLWGIAGGQERSLTVDEMLSLLPDPTGLREEVEGYLDQLISSGVVSSGRGL